MQNLKAELQRLRIVGGFAQARDLIRAQPGFSDSPSLQRLLHEHEDFWWAPIEGRRVTLRRRGPGDIDFVRACWADTDFMRKFNRLARPLPTDDSALRGILARERAGNFGDARALHWTIHGKVGPIGFISATDYAPAHRRCEFLVGMLRQSVNSAPTEACHLAAAFLRDRVGIERLTAYFYEDNVYAAQVAQKFGFESEGVLKGFIRAADGSRQNLHVAGLLLTASSPFTVKKIHKRFTQSAS